MKITKYGHCCMLVEESGLRLLTDPGSFTLKEQEDLKGIDVVLYTHEHQDHFHVDSLKKILQNNPGAQVIANVSVAEILVREGIPCILVRGGETIEERGVTLEGIGEVHAPIHPSLPPMHNTGFLIAGRFWYPGDSFVDPKKRVEILALPAAGPWMKMSEAIDYAAALKPARAFPVHDAVLNPALLTGDVLKRWFGGILGKVGVPFEVLEIGVPAEF